MELFQVVLWLLSFVKFSRICFSTYFIMLLIDIPQKFTADSVNEPVLIYHIR